MRALIEIARVPTAEGRRARLATLAATLLLALTLAATQAPAPAGAAEPRRLVAVGDVHGAYQELVGLLTHLGLTDPDGHWRGGDAVLVQTGDFLDRGARALEVAELLMRLEREARSAGGEVHVLLGNHEVMNLLGDLRDVHPSIYAALADESSEKRRHRLCRGAVAMAHRAHRGGHSAPDYTEISDRCLATHPPGRIEYLELLAPDGWLGRWLRSLPAVHQQEGVVFLHGGLSPELAADGIAAVNQRVAAEIAAWDAAHDWLLDRDLALPTSGAVALVPTARYLAASDELVAPAVRELAQAEEWLLIRPDGPLWLRGYARWNDAEGTPRVDAVLASLGAERLVVGHTTQSTRAIERRFGGRVLLIDTGMLSEVYGGRAAALELGDREVRAIYLEGSDALHDDPDTGPEGHDEPAGTLAAAGGGSPTPSP